MGKGCIDELCRHDTQRSAGGIVGRCGWRTSPGVANRVLPGEMHCFLAFIVFGSTPNLTLSKTALHELQVSWKWW